MRALKGGIVRAFTSHKGADGYQYRRYVTAIVARLFDWTAGAAQKLPADVLVTLREAGRLTVELQACGRELELARARRRPKDVARLRKQMTPMRTQLLTLEDRLETLAKSTRPRSAFPWQQPAGGTKA